MDVFLCVSGYIGECCSRVHTSARRIRAAGVKMAQQRMKLLLETEGKDADETPIVIKWDLIVDNEDKFASLIEGGVTNDPVDVIEVAVVRDAKGAARGYPIERIRPLLGQQVSQVNADHFELEQGVTWAQFEEALG